MALSELLVKSKSFNSLNCGEITPCNSAGGAGRLTSRYVANMANRKKIARTTVPIGNLLLLIVDMVVFDYMLVDDAGFD